MRKVRFDYDMEIDEDDIREEYDLSDDDEITDDMILEFASDRFNEEVRNGEVNAVACGAEVIN